MIRLLLAVAVLTPLAACHDDGPDDVVGASCRDDYDCYDRCEQGSEFPDGFCTLSCRDDRDCTSDTICVDERDGICLYTCDLDRHCDFLGGGYYCYGRTDIYGDSVGVCIGE